MLWRETPADPTRRDVSHERVSADTRAWWPRVRDAAPPWGRQRRPLDTPTQLRCESEPSENRRRRRHVTADEGSAGMKSTSGMNCRCLCKTRWTPCSALRCEVSRGESHACRVSAGTYSPLPLWARWVGLFIAARALSPSAMVALGLAPALPGRTTLDC